MMDISNETKEQTKKRLIEVLKTSTLRIYETPYYFKETSVDDFYFDPEALAMVKDEEVWSYLIPMESPQNENFKIFSFHFKDGLDNSGFVGWLASSIKEELGSGLFVVCGQNSKKGGIFDYWGCPIEIADEVLGFINKLKS
ncbi:hypothetical protein J0X14_18205 [Muricauda sp. CAU 1633]|uniref:DUF6196 family protein n=1 Tax=Allomuricauda sp. CAU 1633 TaxID=2816036 RepID=UPI001A8FB030|nr:DUF6196 family protein [Muricauda sp. CAU 1633]MBO0324249.1 hypothetical protein [Muricauda sp. CAU 1633]